MKSIDRIFLDLGEQVLLRAWLGTCLNLTLTLVLSLARGMLRLRLTLLVVTLRKLIGKRLILFNHVPFITFIFTSFCTLQILICKLPFDFRFFIGLIIIWISCI